MAPLREHTYFGREQIVELDNKDMKIVKLISYFISFLLLSLVIELYLIAFTESLDFSNFRLFLTWHFVAAVFATLFGIAFLFTLIFFDSSLFKTLPVILLVISLVLFLVVYLFGPNEVLYKFLD
jgi:hypothetical protein